MSHLRSSYKTYLPTDATIVLATAVADTHTAFYQLRWNTLKNILLSNAITVLTCSRRRSCHLLCNSCACTCPHSSMSPWDPCTCTPCCESVWVRRSGFVIMTRPMPVKWRRAVIKQTKIVSSLWHPSRFWHNNHHHRTGSRSYWEKTHVAFHGVESKELFALHMSRISQIAHLFSSSQLPSPL